MLVTIEIDPARRTAAFREVSYLAAGDTCRVVLDGVRGADFGTLKLMLCRDAASESPVASCTSFSAVPNHPSLADGVLALDTSEMAEWFADAVPEESDSDSDSVAPAAPVSREPRLTARASLAERSVRAEGWLVASDSDRVWAACRVPVLLRPGAGTSGASDPSSIRALVSELVAGLVSAALADKADKVPSASAGNLASLDASGNLADSGATPASITAAVVAEIVADARPTMDTLKEIADILGSPQESGTVLKRISVLETGKADSSSLAAVAMSGSYDDLSDRPAIPAAVTVDATLAQPGAAADAKAVGDALRGGFTEWVFSGVPSGYTMKRVWYETSTPFGARWAVSYNESPAVDIADQGSTSATELTFLEVGITGMTATRHAFPPTKTSQLTNDGDGSAPNTAFVLSNDTRLSDARTPTAHHATHAVNGSDPIAPADIGAASATDLPYRLVELTTPTEWVFSGVEEWFEITGGPDYDTDQQGWYLSVASVPQGWTDDRFVSGSADATSLTFTVYDQNGVESDATVVVTKTGYALLDRAGNRVVVTGDTTLTLPTAHPGYLRDFLVRLEISGSTVPTITFAVPFGEPQITWLGGDPPQSFGPGVHLISISESAQGEFVFIDGMLADPESAANKVISLSAQSTDVQYPSAKCVYGLVGDVESVLAAINGGVAS